jgi:hypothetical protein
MRKDNVTRKDLLYVKRKDLQYVTRKDEDDDED